MATVTQRTWYIPSCLCVWKNHHRKQHCSLSLLLTPNQISPPEYSEERGRCMLPHLSHSLWINVMGKAKWKYARPQIPHVSACLHANTHISAYITNVQDWLVLQCKQTVKEFTQEFSFMATKPVLFQRYGTSFIPVSLPLATHIQSHNAVTDFLNGVCVQDHMTPPLLCLIYRTYFADTCRALSLKVSHFYEASCIYFLPSFAQE